MAVGLALAVGAGAFANFTDSDTAGRAVDAGQLDIEMGPLLLSSNDVAPGDMMSRGLAIDFPTATNDGNLVENVGLTFGGSTATLCSDVNTDCDMPGANLLGGEALTIGLLACPGTGTDENDWVPGVISDANSTIDDDSDPATDSRMDGPGPYTCSTGDFVVVTPDGNDCTTPTDCTPLSDPRLALYATSYAPGAPGTSTGTEFTLRADEIGALPSRDASGVGRFADGTRMEMVSCVAMNRDIGTMDWSGNNGFGSNVPDGEFDNDFQNLSTNINFTAEARQGTGEVQPRQRDTNVITDGRAYAADCEALSTELPNPFVGGTNTIQGKVWQVSLECGPGYGLNSPNIQSSGNTAGYDYAAYREDPPGHEYVHSFEGLIGDLSPFSDPIVLIYDPDGPNEQQVEQQIQIAEDGYRFENLADGNYRVTIFSHRNTLGASYLEPNLGGPGEQSSDWSWISPNTPLDNYGSGDRYAGAYDDITVSGGQIVESWVGFCQNPT